MTEDSSLESVTDIELVDLTRSGDPAGFAALWHRFEAETRRYARRLAPPSDADDIVQEAFTQTYQAITRGHGPRDAFRPYIYQAVRSAAYRRHRQNPATDPEDLLAALAVDDETARVAETDLLVRAFRSIGARWREVLWLQEVEDLTASEIGEIMQITPAAVSVLAMRAREGLRQAWVQAHLDTSKVPQECHWAVARIAENSRRKLSPTNQVRFDDHVATCTHCAPLVAEAGQVVSGLRAVLLPVFLGVSLDQLAPAASSVLDTPSTLADGFWLDAATKTWNLRRAVMRGLLVLVILLSLVGALVVALSTLRSSREGPAPAPTSTSAGNADGESGLPPSRTDAPVPTDSAPPAIPSQGDPSSALLPSQAPRPTSEPQAPQGRAQVVFSSQDQSSGASRDEPSGGELVNTATGHGTVPDGAPPVLQPTAQAKTSTGNGPALSLAKNAILDDTDADALATPGETIDYTFFVTNTGVVPLTGVIIEDPLAGPVTCPSGTLMPGATLRCTADAPYRVTSADAERGQVVNSATARGTAVETGAPAHATPPVQVDDSATVVVATGSATSPGTPWLSATGVSITAGLTGAFVLTTVGAFLLRRTRRGQL